MNRFGRVVIKTILWIVGSIIALLLLLIFLIRLPSVQNYVVGKATTYLENKIGTRVDIGHIYINFPKKLELGDVYFADQSNDTLIAGESLMVDINMFKLLRNTVEINQLELKGLTAKINRTLPDSAFNFDYIVSAFDSEEESTVNEDSTAALIFDIDRVEFERIKLRYHDEVIGTAADIDLAHFDTRLKTFDLTGNMAFNLPTINIDGLRAKVSQWGVASDEEIPQADDFGIHDPSVEATSLLPDIGISKLALNDIFIVYDDQTSGMHTQFDIKKLAARINDLDLNAENVDIEELTLADSHSEIFFTPVASPPIPEDTETDSTSMNWTVAVGDLSIEQTDVWFRDDAQPRTQGLDYFNMNLTDLSSQIENLYYSADSISGNLKNLAVADHSGFKINQVRSDFIYTGTGASLKNLYIETPHTRIQDEIIVRYPSLAAISENPQSMQIQAHIEKSHIDMKDVHYLMPDLALEETMKPLMDKRFYIDGRIVGRVDDLRIPQFELSTLDQTQFIATAHIKGLPDTEQLDINLDIKKLVTGRRDLDRLIAPSLLPDSIQLPQQISLTGTFNGGMSGFDTDMKLITEQGNIEVNGELNMGRDTTYNAWVAIDNFNLGEFLNQDSVLGFVAAEAQVKGSSLDPKHMQAHVLGTINRFDAMGYQYRDIAIDFNAAQGDISGQISSPDPNVQFHTDIHVDMRGEIPSLYAELMVDSINFQNLHLVEEDVRYHGKIIADFQTLDIDSLNGTLYVTGSQVAYAQQRLELDTVSLQAVADSTRNMLLFDSEFAKAHLTGQYKLSELSASISDIIQTYYNPSGVQETYIYSPQQFEFSAQINHSNLLRDFIPELEKMDDITLDGTFQSEDRSIMVKLVAPELIYSGTEIENVGFDVISADSTLYYSALVGHVLVGDVELTNTVASGTVKDNLVDFGLWVKDNEEREQYHLGAQMQVQQDAYTLSLHEDGLMLNYEDWSIDPNNQLTFGRSGVRASQFRLSQTDQELLIQSRDSSLNAPIDVNFNNFRIETFSEILDSETLKLGGGINGQATVGRLESNPVFTSDLTIDQFFFGTDTIGNVAIQVNNIKENSYSADIHITENGNDVQLTGDIISPPNGEMQIDAVLSLSPMQMQTIQAFSMGSLRDASGSLAGDLHITGTTSAPRINGELTFNDAVVNATMLNSAMTVDGQKIYFTNQGINFKQFDLVDSKGNTARLAGSIRTQTYTDFQFNLSLTSDDFEVMNSTREDNDLFFGKMYVTSNLKITGDLEKPRIDGSVRANENTDFNFIVPNEDPGVAQREGVVKFVNRSDTTRANVFAQLDSLTTVSSELSGYDIALNLSTDREAKFKVILDEGTQDALNIQGVAELATSIDGNNQITMSGTFTVEEGNYTFSFGPISKDFTFRKGSTITWNGDPLDARMDITAVYTGKFATLELVQNQIGGESPNLYKQRIPFNVLLRLTGELFSPEINFDIDLDENNAIVSQDVVSKVNVALANIKEDPAELNKQVFSLIALGRFMSANPFESLSGGGTESMVRNTVSSFLTSQLNNLASDLIQGVELDFNLNSEEDYLTGNAQTRTDLNVGISKMLFNDRLKITIGSNFEVEGNTRPGEKASNIAGDISLDYQLSEDGRYFARVYRKNQYQATLQGQFVETGIGFIINMSYDQFKELFMNSNALAQYYNTESRGFRRRFDVERMETDSVYRDSVRMAIRDSLMTHSPEFRKRVEERRQEELKTSDGQVDSQEDTGKSDSTEMKPNQSAIKNEEEEGGTDAR